MTETWTLPELVAEAAARIAALPPPKNGQVRAVPDERTIRYYGTIGLVARPAAMRGRTALYDRRHLAQVVAIKRLQSAGRSLAEIQQLWPTLDDQTLARMTGVELPGARGSGRGQRAAFWKREPAASAAPEPAVAPSPAGRAAPAQAAGAAIAPASHPVELRLELAPGVSVVVALSPDAPLSFDPADVRALRAAAAPLATELAKRGLIAQGLGTLEEP